MKKQICHVYKNDTHAYVASPERCRSFVVACRERGGKWNRTLSAWQFKLGEHTKVTPMARKRWTVRTLDMPEDMRKALKRAPAETPNARDLARKQDTRRKILLGHAAIKLATENPQFKARLFELLNEGTDRASDREMLKLDDNWDFSDFGLIGYRS